MSRRLPPSGRMWTRDDLTAHIETEHLDGSVEVGTALPSERVMSETFGVSRPFIREVLRGLQQRGLIDVVPGRGSFVRDTNIADIARTMRHSRPIRSATPRDLIEARATLEGQTVVLAAQRATAADLAAIHRAFTAFEEARHLLDRARADIAFHSLIARASKNPILETMFGSIATPIFEIMLRSLADAGTTAMGAPHHGEIMQALTTRDHESAMQSMTAHIHVAKLTYGEELDMALEVVAGRSLQRAYGQRIPVEEIVRAALTEFSTVWDA